MLKLAQVKFWQDSVHFQCATWMHSQHSQFTHAHTHTKYYGHTQYSVEAG